MLSVVGYARVSTSMQVVDGLSLEAQQEKIRTWAQLQDASVKSLHVDAGISGKDLKHRQGLMNALSDCQKGDALVVHSLSRLSRSTQDALAIRNQLTKKGVRLVSLSENIDTSSASGEFMYTVLAAIAQLESQSIRERVILGMHYKKAQGQRIGTVPYGFKLADDQVTLVKEPYEQSVIQVVYEYHRAGFSLRGIVRELQQRGFLSRAGKAFQKTQIVRMLEGMPAAKVPQEV